LNTLKEHLNTLKSAALYTTQGAHAWFAFLFQFVNTNHFTARGSFCLRMSSLSLGNATIQQSFAIIEAQPAKLLERLHINCFSPFIRQHLTFVREVDWVAGNIRHTSSILKNAKRSDSTTNS
jgi:hypothetical protein